MSSRFEKRFLTRRRIASLRVDADAISLLVETMGVGGGGGDPRGPGEGRYRGSGG
ncbi:unnamed protein product [Penicillium roqueforti FM164]|uniref:Uncharacterized protein n=1 Tax=Penicillium roqueforti (strain FM164) TaxID=1365484 RepID=W6QKQ3_PENRF|nr:unnamed protein product [Penicillium roqueforti FM164]